MEEQCATLWINRESARISETISSDITIGGLYEFCRDSTTMKGGVIYRIIGNKAVAITHPATMLAAGAIYEYKYGILVGMLNSIR